LRPHQVGDGRLWQAAAGDVREVTRPGGIEALGNDHIEEKVEKLGNGPARPGERLDERSGQSGAALRVRGRLDGEVLDMPQNALLRGVDQAGQALAGQLETAILVHARVS
jgi:hypothetical protein